MRRARAGKRGKEAEGEESKERSKGNLTLSMSKKNNNKMWREKLHYYTSKRDICNFRVQRKYGRTEGKKSAPEDITFSS